MKKIFNNSRISIRQFQIMIIFYLLSIASMFMIKLSCFELIFYFLLSISIIFIVKEIRISNKKLKNFLLILFYLKIFLALYMQVQILNNFFSRDKIFFLGVTSIYLAMKNYETRARLTEILIIPFLISMIIIFFKYPNSRTLIENRFNIKLFFYFLMFSGVDYLIMSKRFLKSFDTKKIIKPIIFAMIIIIFLPLNVLAKNNFFQVFIITTSCFYILSLNFWFILRFLENPTLE